MRFMNHNRAMILAIIMLPIIPDRGEFMAA